MEKRETAQIKKERQRNELESEAPEIFSETG